FITRVRNWSIPDPPLPLFDTPSLHDALPIYTMERDEIFNVKRRTQPMTNKGGAERANYEQLRDLSVLRDRPGVAELADLRSAPPDRKSTRLNSSHVSISYAVFCLKKKKYCDR